jgi:hypothetical protein
MGGGIWSSESAYLSAHRAQRVLHQLEEHLVQMAGHVREREGFVAPEDLNLGRVAVLSHADAPRVLDGVPGAPRRAETFVQIKPM